MACVYIPVQNTSEEVRVALEQLPKDATDILDILKAEQAPLNLWLTFAVKKFMTATALPLLSSPPTFVCLFVFQLGLGLKSERRFLILI
jgi:hypothetical protein